MKPGLLELAQGLSRIVTVADGEMLLEKKHFEIVAKKVAPGLKFTGDDWIPKAGGEGTVYPSETASIALTERDENGNIVKTGIAALYSNFPIVVADETGCYLYKDNKIVPIVSVDRTFVNNPSVPIGCHIFGQKSIPRWVWMNGIIGFLNKEGIRTSNSMGPYFVLRDFFYHHRKTEKGIVIIPMKMVVSEPFSVKPKAEISAFIISALNYGLSDWERFILTNMSGKNLFQSGEIEKVEGCESPYCAAGWVAGPNEELVFKVLSAIKKAAQVIPSLDPGQKTAKLVEDLDCYRPQI